MTSLAGQKILLAAEYIEYGGTRTYFKELVRFYAGLGADVLAVTTYPSQDSDMQRFLRDHGFTLRIFSDVESEFGDGFRRATPSVWNPGQARQERKMFERLCAETGVDRVVISVGTSGLFLSATHVRPRPIMIAHGYPHGTRQQILGRWLHGGGAPVGLRIVTVSEYSAKLFRRIWATERRGIDVRTIWSSCGQPPLSFQPWERRDISVITASLLESYKEPFRWIDIAKQVCEREEQLSQAPFVWLGDGTLLHQSRAYALKTGIDSIQFPGWDSNPVEAYGRSRVYLQTSSKEALGLSVVDAIRHGLPCVVPDVGGMPEVVLNNVNGYVVPAHDIQAAANAIIELLTNQELWMKMSDSAREVYRERFSPELWHQSMLTAHLQ